VDLRQRDEGSSFGGHGGSLNDSMSKRNPIALGWLKASLSGGFSAILNAGVERLLSIVTQVF